MKKTQEQIVIEQLKQNGFITRNWCLQNYISRLGAIICDLNKKGWDIQGDWIKTEHSKDYKYHLISHPTRTITQIDESAPPVKIGGVWRPVFKEVTVEVV
jgi:hypothetical protein